MQCGRQCYVIGGPWITVDPDCPVHGTEAEEERARRESECRILIPEDLRVEVAAALRRASVRLRGYGEDGTATGLDELADLVEPEKKAVSGVESVLAARLDGGEVVVIDNCDVFSLLPRLAILRSDEHDLSKPRFQKRLRAAGWRPTSMPISGVRRSVWVRPREARQITKNERRDALWAEYEARGGDAGLVRDIGEDDAKRFGLLPGGE